MSVIRSIALSALALTFAQASIPSRAAGVEYTFDPHHTQVNFKWNHFGFSNPEASFDHVTGKILWDAADPTQSSVTAKMAVGSVHTHVPALDEKFESPAFFDASKYPDITFQSTKVVRGSAPGTFIVDGNLTVHGITKPVRLDATLNKVGEHGMSKKPAIGFDASATLKRSEFGIDKLVPGVSDEIRVKITVEANASD